MSVLQTGVTANYDHSVKFRLPNISSYLGKPSSISFESMSEILEASSEIFILCLETEKITV